MWRSWYGGGEARGAQGPSTAHDRPLGAHASLRMTMFGGCDWELLGVLRLRKCFALRTTFFAQDDIFLQS